MTREGRVYGTSLGTSDHVFVWGHPVQGAALFVAHQPTSDFYPVWWNVRQGNGVAHLDLAFEEGELVILSCGVSQDAPVDVIGKPSCWVYSMEDLQEAQAEDRDL